MKKIFIILLSMISIIVLSCNNGSSTTTPIVNSDISAFSGTYISKMLAENYTKITINTDSSMHVEYNNGDGQGTKSFDINPIDIVESSNNLYNIEYISPTDNQKKYLTIFFDRYFMTIYGWSTDSSGLLCREDSINTDSGISKHQGIYIQNTTETAKMKMEITAGGSIKEYKNDVLLDEIEPGFIDNVPNQENDTYNVLGKVDKIIFSGDLLIISSTSGYQIGFTKQK